MLNWVKERRGLLRALGLGAVGIAGLGTAGLVLSNANGAGSTAPGARGVLRSFEPTQRWLNTAPMGAADLNGKVVLVNFWTYSCINSLRALPYLREWARKYQDRGLVVIGVHTPEFAFEHDIAKVERACEMERVNYPVVLDNDYEIWSAFANNAWPGFYFIDAEGRIRDRVLGEGNYDASERLIQQLLSETGAMANDPIADIPGTGAQAAPDWATLRSPETYVGYAKASNFASRGGLRTNTPAEYEASASLRLNHWDLSGLWRSGEEFATSNAAGAAIRFRYHARDMHLVLGRNGQPPVPFRVAIDGEPPGTDHGVDIDAEGRGLIEEDRMYQIVRQAGSVRDRTVEVTFSGEGARVYAFTFG